MENQTQFLNAYKDTLTFQREFDVIHNNQSIYFFQFFKKMYSTIPK